MTNFNLHITILSISKCVIILRGYFSADYSIVVIGGIIPGVDTLNNVTVLSLGSSLTKCTLPELPYGLSGAGSVVLSDDTIMICGGLRNDTYSKQCATLTSQGWIDTFQMVSFRYSF